MAASRGIGFYVFSRENVLDFLDYCGTVWPLGGGEFREYFGLLEVDFKGAHLRESVVSYFGHSRDLLINLHLKPCHFALYLFLDQTRKLPIFLLIMVSAPGMLLTISAVLDVNSYISFLLRCFHHELWLLNCEI